MAPARLKAWGWPVAAALAAGFLVLLAMHGERPEPGLARFAPAGLLADWPAEQVAAIEIDAGTTRRSYRRDGAGGGGWRSKGGAVVAADLAGNIETGLKLLRNSAPERADLVAERLGDFGLEPPRLVVTARRIGGDSRTIEFGGPNPLGLERYARIAGHSQILLMPGFVAEAWERLATAP